MASLYFTGDTVAVAQVDTVQITGYHADTTYILTVGGLTVSVAGDTDEDTTATNLCAAWNASTHPYFSTVTASVATDTVTLTANTAGVPFIAASSVSGGAGTIGAVGNSTACTGPNWWSEAGNWSTGAVPVNTNDVVLADMSTNICWGLDQDAVTLASLEKTQTFSGSIGLHPFQFATTAVGDGNQPNVLEYRQHCLKIGADTIDLGRHHGVGTPAGSSRIAIWNAKTSGGSTLTVHDTASSSDLLGRPAVTYRVVDSDANVYVRGGAGGVGIAKHEPLETATLALVSVTGSTSRVWVGDGTTLTTYSQAGGANTLQAAATVTTVTCDGGTLTTDGDFLITTLNADGGNVYLNNVTGSVDVTTLNVNGGNVDATTSTAARTWSTVNWEEGAIAYNAADVTMTAFNGPTELQTLGFTR